MCLLFCYTVVTAVPASVIQFRLMLEDRAGGGVDLVAVRHAAGLELDLVAREGSFCISKSSLLSLSKNASSRYARAGVLVVSKKK